MSVRSWGIRRQDVGVAALTLPLLVVSALWVWTSGHAQWRDPQLLTLALMHVSLLARGRAPWLTFAVTALGALVLLAAPTLPPGATGAAGPLPAVLLPSTALFGIAIYSVAAHVQLYRWFAFVIGLAGVAEITAALWAGLPWFLAPTLGLEAWRITVAAIGVLLVALTYVLGRWRALSHAYGTLDGRWRDTADDRDSLHLDYAVAAQQARMAREVQVAVADHIDEILDAAAEGRRLLRRSPGLASEAFSDITTRGEDALGRIRGLQAVLDDPETYEVTDDDPNAVVLAPEHALSPQPQLADLPKLIDAARGQGLAVSFDVQGDRGHLPVAGQLALYRVVQEALTNTVTHAGAGAVATVVMDWYDDQVVVTVDDELPPGSAETGETDGIDATDRGVDYHEGRGMRVVRERLEALGGWLEADPVERGFRVRGIVPRESHSEAG